MLMNTLQYLSGDQFVNTKFTNVGEALGYALPKALFGFLVVFGVLALIWGILSLMKVFFYTIPNAKKSSATVIKAENTSAVDTPAEAVNNTVTDDMGAVVAAITAAISAYRAESGEGNTGFRVVSFKKRK